MFVMRHVDPKDADNFLMSESVHGVALEYEWWSPDEGLLDFTKVYSDGEYAHKYYSGRRVWGGYQLAAPSQKFPEEYTDLQADPAYPVFVKPDFKLSEMVLFLFHRYTYQGTKYDLGAPGNLTAGPFGSPDRWKAGLGEKQVKGNWERPIGLYRTSDTYVVKSQADSSFGGVLWFGPASALGTVFTPFVVGMNIPSSLRSGHHAQFSRESAFWAACFLHNVANLKWSYAIQDIEKEQFRLEENSVAVVERLQAQYSRDNNLFAVGQALRENAALVVNSLWTLSDTLVFKYASGFVNEPPDGMSQMVGYPAWWLRAVGYKDGPPPPPTKPKCCNPPKPLSIHDEESLIDELPGLTGKAAMRQHLRS